MAEPAPNRETSPPCVAGVGSTTVRDIWLRVSIANRPAPTGGRRGPEAGASAYLPTLSTASIFTESPASPHRAPDEDLVADAGARLDADQVPAPAQLEADNLGNIQELFVAAERLKASTDQQRRQNAPADPSRPRRSVLCLSGGGALGAYSGGRPA